MVFSNAALLEKELIERAKNNDKKAFLKIYDKYFQKIYDYAYYRTMNITEAEEITSQTFLKAIENIKSFEYRNISISVWLYKIASNTIIDLYRKNKDTVVYNELQHRDDVEKSPEYIIEKKAEHKKLIDYIKVLPSNQQQAVILRYIQGMSYKDIAAVMGKTEGAVKQLLHRALTSLRERMMKDE